MGKGPYVWFRSTFFFTYQTLSARVLKYKQTLKCYISTGSHCPIGFCLVIHFCDGVAVLIGANDLWYHRGQSCVYVSPFHHQLGVWRAAWVS